VHRRVLVHGSGSGGGGRDGADDAASSLRTAIVDDSINNKVLIESRTNQLFQSARLYLASPAEVSVSSRLYERVREARKLTGLTQEALALDLSVTRSAVAQWEMADGTAPAVEHLIALARRSGLTFEYLATGRGERVFGEPLSVAEEAAHYRQLSDQQARLLDSFETLSPRQRAGLLDLIGAGKHRR